MAKIVKLLIKPLVIKIDNLERNLNKIRRMYYSYGRYNIKNDAEFKIYSFNRIILELQIVSSDLYNIKLDIDKILENDKEIRDIILNKLYYNWVISNFFNAKKKIQESQHYIDIMSQLLKYTIEDKTCPSRYRFFATLIPNFVILKKKINIISVCVKDIMKKVDTEEMFKRNLKEYIIQKDKIRKGDVILYYDSEDFLKHDFLALLIAYAENSRITHSAIICQAKKNNVKIISGTALAEKIDIFDIYIEKARFLFVMRPNIQKEKMKYLYKSLDLFEYKLKDMDEVIKFGEKKVWVAAIIGFIHLLSVTFFHHILGLENPFKAGKKYFCSELVDDTFKSIGVYLTARSEREDVVGPSELFFSPYLDFVGVLCNNEDIPMMEKEKLVL
jgi:hypothetical protein